MNNLLIINCVPQNVGDEAILRSTVFILKEHYKDCNINVLVNNLKLANLAVNDLKLNLDFELICNTDINVALKWFRRLLNLIGIKYYTKFSQFFASNQERKVLELFKNSDLIILSGGSYFVEKYNFRFRLRTLKMILKLRKKVIIFPQSIGPIKDKGILTVLSKTNMLFVRDPITFNFIIQNNPSLKNIILINDIVFISKMMYNINSKSKNNKISNLVVNFRHWENVDILEKAIQIVNYIIITYNINVIYISTCQGYSNYIDDTEIAFLMKKDILDQSKFTILQNRNSSKEFLNIISNYDAYFGMRLHGAILGMTLGIPSFVINYEHKSKGIFEKMGLENQCVDLNADVEEWKIKFDSFYDNFLINTKKTELLSSNECKFVYQTIRKILYNIENDK